MAFLESLRVSKQAYLTGDVELDRGLKDMPLAMQRAGLRFATREAAYVVLAEAKRRVPVSSGGSHGRNKGGFLKSSLKVRAAREDGRGRRLRRGTFGHAVTIVSKGNEGHMFKGDAFYGGILELGWRHWKDKSFHQRKFLRPALYESRERVRSVFVASSKDALAKVAAGMKLRRGKVSY